MKGEREGRERGERKGKEGGGGRVDRVKEGGRDEGRVLRREMKKKISTCN